MKLVRKRTRRNPNGGRPPQQREGPHDFRDLVPYPEFYETVDRLRGKPHGGKAIGTVHRAVEQAFDVAARDDIRDQLRVIAETKVLPDVLAKMEVIPDTAHPAYKVLEAATLHELAAHLIAPGWRLRRSYRGLIESRLWLRRMRGSIFEPIREDPCRFEDLVKAHAEVIRARDFQPPLDRAVRKLSDALYDEIEEWKRETIRDLVWAAVTDVLSDRVLEPIGADLYALARKD